jgi:hypothetical protein
VYIIVVLTSVCPSSSWQASEYRTRLPAGESRRSAAACDTSPALQFRPRERRAALHAAPRSHARDADALARWRRPDSDARRETPTAAPTPKFGGMTRAVISDIADDPSHVCPLCTLASGAARACGLSTGQAIAAFLRPYLSRVLVIAAGTHNLMPPPAEPVTRTLPTHHSERRKNRSAS